MTSYLVTIATDSHRTCVKTDMRTAAEGLSRFVSVILTVYFFAVEKPKLQRFEHLCSDAHLLGH